MNGLQLTLESCSASWTVTGPGAYSCGGNVSELYSGPIVMEQALPKAASINPRGTDHLMATVEFPAGAGNDLKGLASNLAFTFTAVQRDGGAR